LAGALLEQAEKLLDKGLHPIRIADGFERACQVAVAHLESVADTIEFGKDNQDILLKIAKTSLGSKMYVFTIEFVWNNTHFLAFRNAMINLLVWPLKLSWQLLIWKEKMLISN
jgi:hypothetical protein